MASPRIIPILRRLLLVVWLLPAGCSSPGAATYEVSGTVTFAGEELADGYITFLAEEDRSAPPFSAAIENGRFTLHVPEGSYRVEVQASRAAGPKDPVMGTARRVQYIPDRYNAASELRAEVTPDGDRVFDFRLSREEPRG